MHLNDSDSASLVRVNDASMVNYFHRIPDRARSFRQYLRPGLRASPASRYDARARRSRTRLRALDYTGSGTIRSSQPDSARRAMRPGIADSRSCGDRAAFPAEERRASKRFQQS